jgi:hypothetical protein
MLRFVRCVSQVGTLSHSKKKKLANSKCYKTLYYRACIAAPEKFQSHLILAFGRMARTDFPAAWPNMLDEVVSCVSDGQNPTRMLAGMRLLLQLLKTYELRTLAQAAADGSTQIDVKAVIVEQTFPTLLTIGKVLVGNDDPQAWSILHLITKAFYVTVSHGELPPHLLTGAVFEAWATLLAQIVVRPVPEAHLRVEEGSSDTMTIFWRPKKWACNAVTRLQVRYGNPTVHAEMLGKKMSAAEKATRTAFSKAFMPTYCPQFLDMMLAHVLSASTGAFAPPRFRNVCLGFVDMCLQEAQLRKIIKPRAEELMFKAIPQLLALSPEDIELFEDDPEEYSRRCNDFSEEFSSARAAAQNLWVNLCEAYAVLRNRAIEWTAQILEHTASQPCGANTDPAVITAETAFNALEVLSTQLTKKNKKVMVAIVERHALPRCASSPGVLRSRICKFLGTYASLDYATPATVKAITENLMLSIQPQHPLPVRVQACAALSQVLAECEDDEETGAGPKAVVRPNLRALLDVVFAMLDEFESEILVNTLEVVSGVFEAEIGPFAVDLITRLVATFARLRAEDDHNSAYAAQQCLGTICTTINATSDIKDLFPHYVAALGPMLVEMISQNGMDFFEETMEIFTVLTYHAPEISDAMLDLFPQIHAAFTDWAVDYVEDMEAPMDNLITRATERFVTRPGYVDMVLDICMQCVLPDQSPASAMIATNLFEPIAQATKNHAYPPAAGPAAAAALAHAANPGQPLGDIAGLKPSPLGGGSAEGIVTSVAAAAANPAIAAAGGLGAARCPDLFIALFIPALITRIHHTGGAPGAPGSPQGGAPGSPQVPVRLLRNKGLQLAALRAVGNAFYANPQLTAAVLASRGMLAGVLELWIGRGGSTRGYHARKVFAVGMLSALSLGSQAPTAIVAAAPALFRAAFAMIEACGPVRRERERRVAILAAGGDPDADAKGRGDEDEDEDDSKWDNYDVDENPEDETHGDEEAEYLRMLQKHAKLALTGELDEDDEEESDDDESEDEDLTYMAAIDEVNEQVAARALVEQLRSGHQEFYAAIVAGLAQEDAALVERVCAASTA